MCVSVCLCVRELVDRSIEGGLEKAGGAAAERRRALSGGGVNSHRRGTGRHKTLGGPFWAALVPHMVRDDFDFSEARGDS